MGDNDKATFGAGDDLQIFHNGTESFIREVGEGGLKIDSNGPEISLRVNATENALVAESNGAVTVYYDNNSKLATTDTGIDVTGEITADGLTVEAASNALIRISDSTNANQRLDLQHNGGVASLISGNNGAHGILKLVSYDGTDTVERFKISGNGNIGFFEDTGTTEKLVWSAASEDLNFADSVKATFGADDDLQIYHDGSNSYIDDVGTGNLLINADSLRLRDTTGSPYLLGNVGAEVRLYYAGSTKLSTTATGIDVTGTATMDGLDISSNGNDSFTQTHTDGNTVIFTQAGTGGDVQWRNANGGALINTAATNRALFDSNGDISFYEDTGTTPKLFWDASAESLGIGTSSPAELVHAADTSTGGAVGFRAENSEGHVNLLTNGGGLQIETSASGTVATIDSSGNVLVGKTSASKDTVGAELKADGRINATMSSGSPLLANRKTSDGDIATFQKDGTTVGSIGTTNSDLTIGTGDVGFRFRDGSNDILPFDVGSNSATDGVVSLGAASNRYNDLYLSGGVYLGGTDDANLLDDYEEGTWTPTLGGGATATNMSGKYTKVGRLVTVFFTLENSTISGTPDYIVSGLPFTNGAERTALSVTYLKTFNTACETLAGFITGNGSNMEFLGLVQGGNWIAANLTAGTGRYVYATASYQTA